MKHKSIDTGARRWNRIAVVTAAIAAFVVAAAGQAQQFEPDTVTLRAADLVPQNLLQGPHYKVQDAVKHAGFMDSFTINTDFGVMQATGQDQLRQRIREVAAVAKLKEASSTKVFVESAGQAAGRTAKSIGNAIQDPKGTLEGLPEGVGRLFQRVSKTVSDTSAQVKQAQEKDKQAKKEGTGESSGSATSDVMEKAGTAVVKSQSGFNRERRRLAKDLKVDPYTDNPILNAELDRVAEVATAGSLGFNVLMPGLGVVSMVGTASNLVWDMSPTDLRIRNEKSVLGMGVDESLKNRFFRNRNYGYTRETRFMVALEAMDGVANRSLLVNRAAEAQTPPEAEFYTRMAEMLASYHKQNQPIAKIVDSGRRVPLAVSKAGNAVMMLPVDQLRWTQRVSEAAPAFTGVFKKHARGAPEVWISGTVSAAARKNLEASGWKIRDRVSRS